MRGQDMRFIMCVCQAMVLLVWWCFCGHGRRNPMCVFEALEGSVGAFDHCVYCTALNLPLPMGGSAPSWRLPMIRLEHLIQTLAAGNGAVGIEDHGEEGTAEVHKVHVRFAVRMALQDICLSQVNESKHAMTTVLVLVGVPERCQVDDLPMVTARIGYVAPDDVHILPLDCTIDSRVRNGHVHTLQRG